METTTVNYNEDMCWFENGKLHRTDGPARISVLGVEYWYQYGNLHRENGPAIDNGEQSQHWYLNGRPHRISGPAVIYEDGTTEYWVNGVQVDELTILLLQYQTQSAEAVL